jgi:hypothetical protein
MVAGALVLESFYSRVLVFKEEQQGVYPQPIVRDSEIQQNSQKASRKLINASDERFCGAEEVGVLLL